MTEALDFAERPTILVVDDTPDNLALMSGLLKDQYKVKVANSGDKALKQVQGEVKPDLILLDIMMPQMDGFEVLERLKEDPQTSAIPVIMLTARKSREDMQRARDLGAVEYITKPFKAIEVVDKVLRHIGQS